MVVFQLTTKALEDLRERNPTDTWGRRVYSNGQTLVVPCFVSICRDNDFETTQAIFVQREACSTPRKHWRWTNIFSLASGKATELPQDLCRFLSTDDVQGQESFEGPTLFDAPLVASCRDWYGQTFPLRSHARQFSLLHQHNPFKHLVVAYVDGTNN